MFSECRYCNNHHHWDELFLFTLSLSPLWSHVFLFTLCFMVAFSHYSFWCSNLLNVTSGIPIKLILLSFRHSFMALWLISCFPAQFDVQSSNSISPVPDEKLAMSSCSVQWYWVTNIWSRLICSQEHRFHFFIPSRKRDIIFIL